MSLRQQQNRVSEFLEENDMQAPPEFRIMDFISEAGEIVKDAVKTAEYGGAREKLDVKEDEIGDVLFSILAVADSLDIDAEKAFERAMEKYERRIDEKGDAGSGSHS
ncbi:MazG nucleotide pyrophosphohydrolase domain-containing protein [Candidatus Nanohalovita haloferacivicina]|uniref:MazG nucleotide pyrophosphohydrolase domain-containing protein n=1 Tax=Candidatus Nanohalovita haloferacivicina TaxID=2978046 RepID=UPI00325FBA02|nr:Nucleotide pyrophosphohydrolase [Candidatus Nanohalobia archaeon BNXNv]